MSPQREGSPWPTRRDPPPDVEVHERGPTSGDVVSERVERHHRRRYHPDGSPAEDHLAIRVTRRYRSTRLWKLLEGLFELVAGVFFVAWAALLWTTGVFWAGVLAALAERSWGGAHAVWVLGIGIALWYYIITNDSPASRFLFAIYSVGIGISAYVLTEGDPYSIVMVGIFSLLLAPLVLPEL